MKYNEDKILKEIGDYIKSTYGEHYSTGKGGFQVLDLLKTLKIGKDFVMLTQSNICVDMAKRMDTTVRPVESGTLCYTIIKL